MAKIFLVDDDKNIIFIFQKYLEMLGHEIIDYAYNGVEAIQKFKDFKEVPDLILMDHIMPLKTGIETTKEILKINPQTNIIFISADISVKEEAINLGINSFMEKPIDFLKLKEKIIDVTIKKNYSQLEDSILKPYR